MSWLKVSEAIFSAAARTEYMSCDHEGTKKAFFKANQANPVGSTRWVKASPRPSARCVFRVPSTSPMM